MAQQMSKMCEAVRYLDYNPQLTHSGKITDNACICSFNFSDQNRHQSFIDPGKGRSFNDTILKKLSIAFMEYSDNFSKYRSLVALEEEYMESLLVIEPASAGSDEAVVASVSNEQIDEELNHGLHRVVIDEIHDT